MRPGIREKPLVPALGAPSLLSPSQQGQCCVLLQEHAHASQPAPVISAPVIGASCFPFQKPGICYKSLCGRASFWLETGDTCLGRSIGLLNQPISCQPLAEKLELPCCYRAPSLLSFGIKHISLPDINCCLTNNSICSNPCQIPDIKILNYN